jgi:hypothetical protein
VIALSYDCYLRSQDWRELRAADVHTDGASVALLFGVQERGQKSKTGTNQGVVVSRSWIACMLLAVRAGVSAEGRVFSFSQSSFRDGWQRFWAGENCSFQRAVHDIRHAGAANDVGSGRRRLEGVQRRGRWKHLASCYRYAKTHLLVRARQLFGAAILKSGADFGKDPERTLIKAIQRGPGASTTLGQEMIRRLRSSGDLRDSKEDILPGQCSPRHDPMGDLEARSEEQLRGMLRARKLSTKGRKRTLLRRLQTAQYRAGPAQGDLEAWEETAPSADDKAGDVGLDVSWTSEGDEGADVQYNSDLEGGDDDDFA